MMRSIYLLLATFSVATAQAQVVTTKPGRAPLVYDGYKLADPVHTTIRPGVWEGYTVSAGKADYARLGELATTIVSAPRHQTWYQGDPADSLYRAAYSMFGRQEYRPAAERFADLRNKHPNTRYWCDASYYEAFARQRLGTPNDLRTAVRVLDAMAPKCSSASRNADVPELRVRIDGALARQGDADANTRLREAVSRGTCDREEQSVKVQALSSLAQMDPQAATPVLRTVLSQRDACGAPVRRQALELIARRNDPEAVSILGQVARTDPDRDTQMAAVYALSRMSNDAAYAALEDYLRNSTDERTQMAAASAMARNENPRAQAAVRALIERNDVAERIRYSAINALADRSYGTVEYWSGLYRKVESDELRKSIINAIGRIQTDEAQSWLLALARNQNEPYEARVSALSRIRSSAPIAELYKILENADSRSMRLTIVSGLAARKEPEATDRLIDIAKTSTDLEVRQAAIRALTQGSRKDDPKVIKALTDLLTRQM